MITARIINVYTLLTFVFDKTDFFSQFSKQIGKTLSIIRKVKDFTIAFSYLRQGLKEVKQVTTNTIPCPDNLCEKACWIPAA